MTCQLLALCIDANDPLRLARFWSGVLGWEMADDSRDGVALVPSDDTGFRIRFLAAQEKEPSLNLGHLHLTSTSLEDQQQTVARSLGLGARHVDVGQRPQEGHVVLADPEGNNFCVIEPGNNWLAGCGVTVVTPTAISSERWQESFGKGSASCTSATRNERSISSSDLLLLH